MKTNRFFLVIILVIFAAACTKDEYEFYITNGYMIVNKTSDTAEVRLNYPPLTQKILVPSDTLKFYFLSDDKGENNYCKSPFRIADTAVIKFKGKKYLYDKNTESDKNPLLFENYKMTSIAENFYTFVFEITE